MPWWQPVKRHRWELLANVNSSCDEISVSCAGRYAPRTGRSLACLTLAAMLSLSPLSRVFGADMSKNCGSFRFGNTLWLSPCRRLLSRSQGLAACRARYASPSAPVPATRWRLPDCSRSPSLLRYLYTKVCKQVKKKDTKEYKQGKKISPTDDKKSRARRAKEDK